MNKTELNAALAKKTGFSKKDTERCMDALYRNDHRGVKAGRESADRWFWHLWDKVTRSAQSSQSAHGRGDWCRHRCSKSGRCWTIVWNNGNRYEEEWCFQSNWMKTVPVLTIACAMEIVTHVRRIMRAIWPRVNASRRKRRNNPQVRWYVELTCNKINIQFLRHEMYNGEIIGKVHSSMSWEFKFSKE